MPKISDYFFSEMRSDLLNKSRLFPAMTSACSCSILIITLQLSFTAMLFTKELSPLIPRGVGLLLMGTLVGNVILVLKSSSKNTIGASQDAPIAILSAPLLLALTPMLNQSHPAEDIFYAIVAVMMFISFSTGILMIMLGHFKFASLIKFIPYPVIGGFLASVGWLIFAGGVGVITGVSLNINNLSAFIQFETALKLSTGIGFAIVLRYMMGRYTHFLVIPAILVSAVTLYFIALTLLGGSFDTAQANGWFLGPFPEGSLWQVSDFLKLSSINTEIILELVPTAFSMFVICVISVLLNSSGLELITQHDMDMNNELKATGTANIFCAAVGAPPFFIGLSISALSYRLSPNNRLGGLLACIIYGGAIAGGAFILDFIPRPIAGGMLLFIGGDMVWEWLCETRKKLPASEYMVIVIIALSSAFIGFNEAVLIGGVISTVLFIVKFSRLSIIKEHTTIAKSNSSVSRPPSHQWILSKYGDECMVLQLENYIFFGTCNKLRDEIKSRVNSSALPELRSVLIDFTNVKGLDSSAMHSFERVNQDLSGKNITIVLTGLSQELSHRFEAVGLLSTQSSPIKVFSNLDSGLSFCEELVVSSVNLSAEQKDGVLNEKYNDMMEVLDKETRYEEMITEISKYLEKIILEKDDQFNQITSEAPGYLFIEAGQITVTNDYNVPEKVLQGKTIASERELHSYHIAGSRIIASKRSTVYRLTGSALTQMEQDMPELAVKLYKYMIHN